MASVPVNVSGEAPPNAELSMHMCGGYTGTHVRG